MGYTDEEIKKRFEKIEQSIRHHVTGHTVSNPVVTVPPTILFGYCSVPSDDGLIYRYMFPSVKGLITGFVVYIGGWPEEIKEIPVIVEFSFEGHDERIDFSITKGRTRSDRRMFIKPGTRMKVYLKDDGLQASDIWFACAFDILPTRAHNYRMEDLDEGDSENNQDNTRLEGLSLFS